MDIPVLKLNEETKEQLRKLSPNDRVKFLARVIDGIIRVRKLRVTFLERAQLIHAAAESAEKQLKEK